MVESPPPFFLFHCQRKLSLVSHDCKIGAHRGETSRLLRLSRLDPEAFVLAFPASSCPYGVSRVAVHADLLDEVPGLGLGKSCHDRPSGATNRIAIYNGYGLPGDGPEGPSRNGFYLTSASCLLVLDVRARPRVGSFHSHRQPS